MQKRLRRMHPHSLSFQIIDRCYLVTRSKRFITEKMNAAESRQQAIRIPQNATKDILSQSEPITPTSRLPTAVAASHPPCIKPAYCGGATLETNDNPIGLKNSSASVSTK